MGHSLDQRQGTQMDRGFRTNEVEWTRKVELRKKVLAMGEACTQLCIDILTTLAGFSTKEGGRGGGLISASVVSHCGNDIMITGTL